jgi:hypothetical protein
MDGDCRDQQNRPERHADDGKPGAHQHCEAANEFDNNRAHAITFAAGTPSA